MTRKTKTAAARKAKSFDRAAFILNLFREAPEKKFSLKHLAAASGGASREGRRETLEIVESLLEEGTIDCCTGNKYRLSNRHRPRFRGKVSMTTSGSLFLRCDELEGDVLVHRRNAGTALDGDTVEFVLTRKSRGGQAEGEIVALVERNRKPYVGVAEVNSRQIFVRCESRRIPGDIYLPRKGCPQVADGDKVAVRIVDWPEGSRNPVGELIEVLGPCGENETEMHAILAEYDLPYRFEPEIEAAAAAIPAGITPETIAARRDMRDRVTFTVDPADAKDFDDALSVQQTGEGRWEIGIHIADVTHYVTPGSVLDEEARRRGTSVYLVDRTVPMLPERLSNDLCSLRPHEDRLCFSAIFTINEGLEILDEWFGRTVIHSDRRFTYAEAQQVIESGQGDCAVEIGTLNRLAQAMRRERFRRGAISFEREEVRFRLDEQGKPLGVYFKEQQEANQMIEEFMLLANRRVAEYCAHRIVNGRRVPRTMVFRVHDEPNAEKLDRFRSFILRFGYHFKAQKGRAVSKELNKLLASVKGRTEENVVSMLAVRSMAKAFYTTDNIGHYGLAFPSYTHFTSPIRRYPDMMVHRLLARYLEGGKSADKKRLEEQCADASDREIVAAEAERASIKYKMVEYMQHHTGELFAGHISGLTDWGIYVELDETHIEGMAMLRDMEGDFWQFDEARYEIYGHATGRTYTLGDPVQVRVKRTDLHRRQLDFELLTGTAPSPRRKRH